MNDIIKAELIELAARILKKLGYLPEAIRQFEETGMPMYSEEPYGILYDLEPDMKEAVKTISESGGMCYAVICGKYIMGSRDMLTMVTYLYVTEDDLRSVGENDFSLDTVLEPYTGEQARLGYRVQAAVSSEATFGDLEHGSVCVKGLHGGLTRTC